MRVKHGSKECLVQTQNEIFVIVLLQESKLGSANPMDNGSYKVIMVFATKTS
jgi:hypothetical protein